MNLIKHLGYEEVKNVLNRKRYDDISYSFSSDSFYKCLATEHGAIELAELEEELLEYRRENNLFEVGDIVTRRNGIARELHKIELIEEYDIKIFSQDMSHSYWAFKGLFRNATDEELKVGYRL